MSPILLPPAGIPVERVSAADRAAVLRLLGIMDAAEAARLDAVLDARWCLVRIDGVGERWRCTRCGCRHAHFTTFCVERPFRGLQDGLHAYWRSTAVPDADLSPEQRAARAEIGRTLGLGAVVPALADRHPRMARALATPGGDFDLGAWVLGTIDPITEAEARRYASLINARARQPVIRV